MSEAATSRIRTGFDVHCSHMDVPPIPVCNCIGRHTVHDFVPQSLLFISSLGQCVVVTKENAFFTSLRMFSRMLPAALVGQERHRCKDRRGRLHTRSRCPRLSSYHSPKQRSCIDFAS